VNKEKALGREFTQRTRSFLFASLGVTFAAMIGLDRLRFYENGVVSLNLPLSQQVVGARASRTTHPRVLRGYAELFTTLLGRRFTVENQFLWKTKTDVARLLGDAGQGDLVGHSTSCAHTWAVTKEKPHCGDCSQCIDRRFAVLASGLSAHDPAAGYGFDLLTGSRPEDQSRVLLAAFLETANRIGEMSEVDFFGHFGEAARVLRHLEGTPQEAARRVYDLYLRQAEQVNGVVTAAIVQNADAIRRRKLPPTCLVRLVSDAAVPEEHEPQPATLTKTDYVFQRFGPSWLVRFAGRTEIVLTPSKGAAYLHQVLARPGVSIGSVDLACQVVKRRTEFALGDAEDSMDKEAAMAYQARIAELDDDIYHALADNDPGAADRARDELTQIRAELRRAFGLNGTARKAADNLERVRKRVGEAIRREIKVISGFDQELGKHLKVRVQCGVSPCYSPVDGIALET
jgi:hypothetical protein